MPSALLTGSARGIGRAIAERLAGAGWEVHAGVRRDSDGAELARLSSRIRPVELDITDAGSIERAAASLPERLDALVNNAGGVVPGPVESLTPEQWREQLELNVIGQAAVTRAVLPRLRLARGRIVFISSVSGRVSTPMTGAYAASKFALEGMADALRIELRPWGVRVVLVEPGAIDTDLWRGAPQTTDRAEERMAPEHRELYARHLEGVRRVIPRMQRQAAPAAKVAGVVLDALSASRPRARYLVGTDARVQAAIAALPTAVSDTIFGRALGVPRRV